MFMKMLTHLHLVVYTWWCWHICKGEEVGVVNQHREVDDQVQDRWLYYQEEQTCLHVGHLVPLERSNFAYVLGSSGVVISVINSLKNVCEKLTHMHKMVNTWWCQHICKGVEKGEEEKAKLGLGCCLGGAATPVAVTGQEAESSVLP